MSFLRSLKESLRDKTRDSLCADLRALRINAQMAERGRAVELIGQSWRGRSLGLIEIQDSPIRWVNIVAKEPAVRATPVGVPGERTTYTNLYLVPDSTISKAGSARSAWVKSVPVFGHVVGVRWKGNLPSDIVEQLGEDLLLSQTLIKLGEDVHIESHPGYRCWQISTNRYQYPGLWRTYQPVSSLNQWYCYETIARHLLKIYPHPAITYYNRGLDYHNSGEYDKAIDNYDKAIELYPNLAYSYYNRGHTEFKKGEYDKAIDDYTKAIELYPDDAEAFYDRGIAFEALGRKDEAIADFWKCCNLARKASLTNLKEKAKEKLRTLGENISSYY